MSSLAPADLSIGARDYVRDNDPRTGRRRDQDPRCPNAAGISRPDIEPLSPAMRGTWPRTIQAPAADAIAAGHAQARLLSAEPSELRSPAAARRGAMTCTPTAAFVQGRHGRGRPGASGPAGRARRPDTIIRRRKREVRPRHGA